MNKTRHIQQRMSQRGVTSEMLEMIERFGIVNGDKITLDRKDCQELSRFFALCKKVTDKMAEKGGYTLIASAEALITVYRLNSFNFSKAHCA